MQVRQYIFEDNFVQGFTLVETLVAISILLLVIIGPMTIAQKGIQSSYYSSDQVTAVFLAQEAMEAIREVRDNEALDSNVGLDQDPIDERPTWDWHDDFVDACASGCAFDVEADEDDPLFTTCSGECTEALYITDEGQYVTQLPGPGAQQSIFKRTITAVEDATKNGMEVTVAVTWNANIFGGEEKEIKLQTWIYDHYSRYGEAP